MISVVHIPGRISLVGLRCMLAGHPAGVLVDVSVGLDLAPAAVSDTLEDAVDLAALADVVRRRVAGPERVLLEAVAVDVARGVLEAFVAVDDVELTVRKTEPAGLDAAEERVDLRLRRTPQPS